MPSRYLSQLATQPQPPWNHDHDHHHHGHHFLVHVLPPTIAVVVVLVSVGLFLAFFLIYRKRNRKRTAPASSPDLTSPSLRHCRRLPYNLLRQATSSFSSNNKLGHGGFGAVYKVSFPSHHLPMMAAVKLMTPGDSIQGEREFYNELSIASSLNSPYTVSLFGFSSNRKKGEFLLVYELMENRSLQEALLDRKCEELMSWKKRFEVICRVAKGLEYLHFFCDPPIIHGDVKPSNVLLDSDFNAKIGDFGLAREKIQEEVGVTVEDDGCSILEEVETESVLTTNTALEGESATSLLVGDEAKTVLDSESSPELGIHMAELKRDGLPKQSKNGIGDADSGRVKEYVITWIGNEMNHEMSLRCLTDGARVEGAEQRLDPVTGTKWKTLGCWKSFDEGRIKRAKGKRKPKEWWREEFCDELTKKKENKTKGKKRGHSGRELPWRREDHDWCEAGTRHKKKKRLSRKNSKDSSSEWWSDDELKHRRSNSLDWASGEIPKSGNVSSTPSMRGTMCYVAPEYGGGGAGQLSEKCDVYSFGVLLLVVISGRRPLQVTASPLSEFERANLISWAKHLACNGKLMDLVDPDIHDLDKDQALVCITVALLCLQRSPGKRPTMKKIVEIFSGEGEAPHLPLEFSPSPPSALPFRSPRRLR